MTNCYKCDGETRRQEVTWPITVGEHEIEHKLTEDVCTACGEWTISSHKLGELELISAVTVLQEQEMTGAILKDVRKSIALKQTELAEYLGVAAETVSRWERGERSMEPWVRLAMLGLLLPKILTPPKVDLLTFLRAPDDEAVDDGLEAAIDAVRSRRDRGKSSIAERVRFAIERMHGRLTDGEPAPIMARASSRPGLIRADEPQHRRHGTPR
jgi:putative zinc finger/helix-turn-helix YgiT family protein